MPKKPLFSIVIPALNEEKYLPLLLEDLAEQTSQDFEVIVVDGNSEDNTQKKALGFSDSFPLQVLTAKKRNVSHQRNIGADRAKGEWVIFMDADNELPSYFLQGVAYQLTRKPQTDVFTCWMDVAEEEDRAVRYLINLIIEMYGLLPNPQAMGALIGCRRSLLSEHSFDETQTYLEDGIFLRSLVKAGCTFTIFREPRWYYSMRRIKKEGRLKLVRSIAAYQFKYLLGGDFSDSNSAKDYPMLGGSYYDDAGEDSKDWSIRMLKKLQGFISTSSNNQLNQAKKILQSIKDYEF